ncbi:Two-component response regulator, YesN/AraC family, consists of REC and AraC-type DNA-binding domains [Paenibacillus sp. UNC496MF]|uniref:response regulator transcription factor n=1 Tax=Paenibacillus sp. UNC496MF TaxID=1502753 RepID=UPI0008E83AD6|nr:response regulator [Paenibacillus sp. UNC496MF]SFJ33849.1 Two-component response regulator, YesN/AraC family, consists of REC and AraC-type DNA-binding domains [Paenibacillus sp. UNC496MF]
MHKVMIVDDESWAIKGIRNAFDWEKHGFEIIGQFTSAYNAWEAIQANKPDLVVTDIRMPDISGLDLMKRAKAHELDTEFVVVSGYAEFEYAQEALRCGALNYFLKPLDVDMADPFLAVLAMHFSQRSAARNPLILESLTSSDPDEIKRYLPLPDSAESCYYQVLAIDFERADREFGQLLALEGKPVYAMEVEAGTRKRLIVLMAEDKACLEGLRDELTVSRPGIRTMGISSISGQLAQMSKLIKEADLSASQVFLSEDPGAVHYEPKVHLVKPCIDEIHRIVQGNQYDDYLDAYINGLPAYFEVHRLGMSEVVCLWNQAVGILINAYAGEWKDMELEFLNYAEIKERFEHFASLCGFLHDVFASIKQGNSRSLPEGDILSCFNRMVAYIDGHYEQRLYLKELSAQFYINQVYCCQLFKKKLGKTFSEYVSELRIKKARDLLRQTNLSIEEIAVKTGYAEYYYFNKVFKKHCGVTPTKFRKS